MKQGFVMAAVVLAAALPAAAQQAQGAAAGKAPPKAESCAACHGPNGNAPQGPYPILAGQTSRYLYLQLRDFQEGRRSDPQMTPMAAGLSRDEMRALADWFAAQAPAPQNYKVDAAKAKLGLAKAEETLCTMCHLGGMKGQNEIPRVAGQNHDYVVKQLQDFKAKKRTNDAGNMASVSATLSDADIENLAHYLAGL
jgi:cytochrome c553